MKLKKPKKVRCFECKDKILIPAYFKTKKYCQHCFERVRQNGLKGNFTRISYIKWIIDRKNRETVTL